jgi:hypothetical protein
VGINSFFGFLYSPRIRFIAPAHNFRFEAIGETWIGKRSKVQLMLDNESFFGPLEITPEMLQKARHEFSTP